MNMSKEFQIHQTESTLHEIQIELYPFPQERFIVYKISTWQEI